MQVRNVSIVSIGIDGFSINLIVTELVNYVRHLY